MAKCDEGYRCDVCGRDVEQITDSSLYLTYVIGELDPEVLHTTAERHIRCNPVLAQFIADDRFPALEVEGDFDKRRLDAQFVRERESLVTRGYCRLHELQQRRGEELSLLDYPLAEICDRREGETGVTES